MPIASSKFTTGSAVVQGTRGTAVLTTYPQQDSGCKIEIITDPLASAATISVKNSYLFFQQPENGKYHLMAEVEEGNQIDGRFQEPDVMGLGSSVLDLWRRRKDKINGEWLNLFQDKLPVIVDEHLSHLREVWQTPGEEMPLDASSYNITLKRFAAKTSEYSEYGVRITIYPHARSLFKFVLLTRKGAGIISAELYKGDDFQPSDVAQGVIPDDLEPLVKSQSSICSLDDPELVDNAEAVLNLWATRKSVSTVWLQRFRDDLVKKIIPSHIGFSEQFVDQDSAAEAAGDSTYDIGGLRGGRAMATTLE